MILHGRKKEGSVLESYGQNTDLKWGPGGFRFPPFEIHDEITQATAIHDHANSNTLHVPITNPIDIDLTMRASVPALSNHGNGHDDVVQLCT